MEKFRKKYGLCSNDLDQLANEIKQKLAKLHPDKHGGEFRSDEEQQEYLRLSDAKDELENSIRCAK